MNHILVVLSPDEDKKRALQQLAPDATFVYRNQKEVSEQDVQEANIILGNVPLAHLADVPKLRWLQLDSAGSDLYATLPVFQKGQAALSNATGSYGSLLAEYMVGATVLLNVGFHTYRDQQNARIWKSGTPARTIEGSRTLVVGLGDIGSHFARYMNALGSTVTGIRRTKGETPSYVESVHTLEALEDLLPESDIVGVCLPQSDATRDIFDQSVFEAMKPGSLFINVGRGTAVDNDALLHALRSGRIGGAVIDVFPTEPLPADHPLWNEPNLLITPHIGGLSEADAARAKILDLCVRNLGHWMSGRPLESEVDLQTGYRKL